MCRLRFNKIYEKTFIVTITSGIVIFLITSLLTLIAPHILHWLILGLVWRGEDFIASYSLPGWVWLIVFILALIGFINIILSIKKDTERVEELEHTSYIEDILHNVRWQWHNDKIYDIRPFCLVCDTSLVHTDNSSRNIFSQTNKTALQCEHCEELVAGINGGYLYSAIKTIERELY